MTVNPAIILTADELARLQRDGELWKQVPNVCAGCGMTTCWGALNGCHNPGPVLDPVIGPAILAAAEPCETCNGHGIVYRWPSWWTCSRCRNGRKRIEVRVACDTCGGWYCPNDICTDPTCSLVHFCPDDEPGTTHDANGTVLAGTVSVAEVLPVTLEDGLTECLGSPHLFVIRNRIGGEDVWEGPYYCDGADMEPDPTQWDMSHLGDPAALIGSHLAHLTDLEAT